MSKFNRTAYIVNLAFEILIDIDDDWSIIAEIFGMQGNEYRKIVSNINVDNLCSKVISLEYFYDDIQVNSNLPPRSPDMCPIKAGSYEAHDILFDMSKVPVTLPLGIKKYKVVYHHLYKNLDILTVAVYYIAE